MAKVKAFMSGDEFRELAAKIGFTVQGIGRWLRIGERTTYRYACETARIPGPTADLIRALASGKITTKQVEATRGSNGRGR